MLSAVCLLALVASAFAAGRWGVPGAIALVLSSLAWIAWNYPMEGRLLVTLSPGHGFVVADVVGLTGLALAGVVLVPRWLRR